MSICKLLRRRGSRYSDTTAPYYDSPLTAGTVTPSSVQLNWVTSDNVGVTYQTLYYKLDSSGTYNNSIALLASDTTHNVTGLSSGTEYNFYIRACDSAGNCSNSVVLTRYTTTAADTTAPIWKSTTLTVTGETASSIGLSWTGATDDVGITGYSVWKHEGATGTFTLHASLSSGTLSYNVTGLSSDTQYVFYVKATDAAGNTSNTNTASQYTTAAVGGALYDVLLGFGTSACTAAKSTYYIDNSNFTAATALYTDSAGTTFAGGGYYSDGDTLRFWDGRSKTFTSNDFC